MRLRVCRSSVAAVFLAASALGGFPQLSTNQPVIAAVRLAHQPSIPIPTRFMGLSHEWPNTTSMLGYSKTGANLAYRQLLANLTAYGNDPIELRIGGDSTDNTGQPSGDRMKPYAELAAALKTRFILGVNLGSRDVALTRNQVLFYSAQLPAGSIRAFELGNEPDHYVKRQMRQAPYEVGDYISDFDKWSQNLFPLLPRGVVLAAPSWAATDIIPSTKDFIERRGDRIGLVSLHFYAGSPYTSHPLDFLLKPGVATTGPLLFAPIAVSAHARGLPFRVTEFNSFYGVGIHGQSDAFSAALWAVDTMFEYVKAGTDGVNWEAEGSNYCSPFLFNRSTAGGMTTFTVKTVTPLYYGLLLFQAATGRDAQIIPVAVDTKANVKAWVTVDRAGRTRAVLINKDLKAQGNIEVGLPGYRQATVIRLLAPSYTSLAGVTFGGQSVDGSADGKLVGAKKTETLYAHNGQFEVMVPVTSAVLMEFSK